MTRQTVICIAVVLVLASCLGGQGATLTAPAPTTTEDPDAEMTTETTAATGTRTTTATTTMTNDGRIDGATLQFYLSDEQNAIAEFAQLTVTVTQSGLKRAGDDGNWTTYDIEARTIDLTRLRGANATVSARSPPQTGATRRCSSTSTR